MRRRIVISLAVENVLILLAIVSFTLVAVCEICSNFQLLPNWGWFRCHDELVFGWALVMGIVFGVAGLVVGLLNESAE